MSDLKKIQQLATEMIKLEYSIVELEESLKALKEAHRKIQEGDLPEMMEAAGVDSFATRDGRTVALDVETYANISKDNQADAFGWLRSTGNDDIIKRTITVEFGKGEDKKAETLFAALQKRKGLKDNTIVGKETVHPSTLRSFVRRCLEAGTEIPQDTFGIFQRTVAKVGAVKK